MAIQDIIDSALSGCGGATAYPGDAFYPKGDDVSYIVYWRVAGEEQYSHDGPATAETSRWQVEIYAPTVKELNPIIAAVLTAMNGLSGDNDDSIHGSFRKGRQDPMWDIDARRYFATLDFEVNVEPGFSTT